MRSASGRSRKSTTKTETKTKRKFIYDSFFFFSFFASFSTRRPRNTHSLSCFRFVVGVRRSIDYFLLRIVIFRILFYEKQNGKETIRVVPVRLPPMVARLDVVFANRQYFIGTFPIYIDPYHEPLPALASIVLTRCSCTSAELLLSVIAAMLAVWLCGECRRFGFPFDCYLITDIYVFWILVFLREKRKKTTSSVCDRRYVWI